MVVEDIFSQLIAHATEGLMTHAQIAEYFDFLGLKGYAKCHTYHYFAESVNYKCLCEYYIKHYNKLPVELKVSNPKVIPENWFKYSRKDVDSSTRKNAISAGFDKWVTWEKATKKLYEQMYQELIAINEIAAALEIKYYINDVSEELAKAEQKMLELKAIDYNISDIIMEQEHLYKKYTKKLREIEIC